MIESDEAIDAGTREDAMLSAKHTLYRRLQLVRRFLEQLG
jgi:hypothetical protein